MERPAYVERGSSIITFITSMILTSKFGSGNIKDSDVGCSFGGISSRCVLCPPRVVMKCLCRLADGGCAIT